MSKEFLGGAVINIKSFGDSLNSASFNDREEDSKSNLTEAKVRKSSRALPTAND